MEAFGRSDEQAQPPAPPDLTPLLQLPQITFEPSRDAPQEPLDAGAGLLALPDIGAQPFSMPESQATPSEPTS